LGNLFPDIDVRLSVVLGAARLANSFLSLALTLVINQFVFVPVGVIESTLSTGLVGVGAVILVAPM
jgi:hypothetical protein